MNNLTKYLTSYLTTFIFFVITACYQDKKITEINDFQCPTKPEIALEKKDVKPISLSSQPITQSGILNHNRSLGYSFDAQSGQRLSYKTNQKICIWIFTPENHLLSSDDLPTTGKYIIQILTLKGSTTFDLTVSLDGVAAKHISSFSTAKSSSSVNYQDGRLSPEKVIAAYYNNANNTRYLEAWNMLSPALQANKSFSKNGYRSFAKWWSKVGNVEIKKTYLVKSNNNLAIVNVSNIYHVKNSSYVPIHNVKFYIRWNDTNHKWDIIRIDKL